MISPPVGIPPSPILRPFILLLISLFALSRPKESRRRVMPKTKALWTLVFFGRQTDTKGIFLFLSFFWQSKTRTIGIPQISFGDCANQKDVAFLPRKKLMKNAHFEFFSFSSKGILGKMGVGAINSKKREKGKS